MRIGNREIGPVSPPFVVAEMSGNHNQSLSRALEIVEAAARAGAHALKLQTYTPDTMTLELDEGEFHISEPSSLWAGTSLYRLYSNAYTPWDWHEPIFARARALGLLAFSTPFDDTAVGWLERLDVPCYKIASFENTDLPLIHRVAATGKPLMISTGMATLDELDETVRAARSSGCTDLILLKCTSTYPAEASNANLLTIPDLRRRFDCEVGLSDHTMGVGVAVAAVALGASVIEKHFTLSRADGGVDSDFSMEPVEMGQLVEACTQARQALGQVSYGPTDAERPSVVFRRSLYVVQDLSPGDTLTRESIRSIRPGLGLAPKHLERVLGKSVSRHVKRGTPLTWDLLS